MLGMLDSLKRNDKTAYKWTISGFCLDTLLKLQQQLCHYRDNMRKILAKEIVFKVRKLFFLL